MVAPASLCLTDEPIAHLAGRMIMALRDEADRVLFATGIWNQLGRARAAGARVRGICMPAVTMP
ncbi:hypothetical protein ACIO87_36900 [Streptomyces sp. NPDC087218]|uniref:hypothetical protein n=1 Tax=Streptomyces sp. NPDC087218 TaxID=3365769 RepID=UPI00380E7D0F